MKQIALFLSACAFRSNLAINFDSSSKLNAHDGRFADNEEWLGHIMQQHAMQSSESVSQFNDTIPTFPPKYKTNVKIQVKFTNVNQSHTSAFSTMKPKVQPISKDDDFFDVEFDIRKFVVEYDMLIKDKSGRIVLTTKNDVIFGQTSNTTDLNQQCDASIFGEMNSLLLAHGTYVETEKELGKLNQAHHTSNLPKIEQTFVANALDIFLNGIFGSIQTTDNEVSRFQKGNTYDFEFYQRELKDNQCGIDEEMKEMEQQLIHLNGTCGVKYPIKLHKRKITILDVPRFSYKPVDFGKQDLHAHHFLDRIDNIRVYPDLTVDDKKQIQDDMKRHQFDFLKAHNFTFADLGLLAVDDTRLRKYRKLGPVHHVLQAVTEKMMMELDSMNMTNNEIQLTKHKFLVAMKLKEDELVSKLY